MRAISCIMIIGVHIAADKFEKVSAVTSTWRIISTYDGFFLLGVPLFFMMSGALILQPSYQVTIQKMISKAVRLILFYYGGNFCFNLIPFFTGTYAFSASDIWNFLIRRTLQGKGTYHLWFLPGLALIYLLVPLVKDALQDTNTCRYVIVIFIVFGGLIRVLTQYRFPGATMFHHIKSIMDESALTGYFGYFVLGHYINRFVSKEKLYQKRLLLGLLFLVGMTWMAVASALDALHTGTASSILTSPLMLPAMLSSASIFAVYKSLVNRVHFAFLAKISFGVYLIHPAAILVFEALGMNTLKPTPLIAIPMYTLLVYLSCLIVVWPIYSVMRIMKEKRMQATNKKNS